MRSSIPVERASAPGNFSQGTQEVIPYSSKRSINILGAQAVINAASWLRRGLFRTKISSTARSTSGSETATTPDSKRATSPLPRVRDNVLLSSSDPVCIHRYGEVDFSHQSSTSPVMSHSATAREELGLQERLLDALVSQNIFGSFLPVDSFNLLVTRDTIYHELLSNPYMASQCKLDEKADAIYNCSGKIFAILIIMECVHVIDEFLKEKISDTDLPFRRDRATTDRCKTLIFRTSAGFKPQSFKSWKSKDIMEIGRI